MSPQPLDLKTPKLVIVPVIALHSLETDSFLLSKRLPGKTLAGLYEYPGGKQERDETPRVALQRELWEELNLKVEINALTPVGFVDFHFSGSEYFLPMYYTRIQTDTAYGKEGQEIFHIPPEQLPGLPMPPANTELTRILLQFLADRKNVKS